ncbi:DoxX family protein [Roseibium sp. RKSG952]|uniref:DoxX family protein n=1 Tax=Roseibium sp. RKSG952 TaxID=2529384 RepID=UPI0012BCD5EE|nr:DoxX family protein [Roseibium sp. RKSG952]MTH99574.1 DoxX family protein [Roseibium sp. RKSG952]
MRFLNSFTHIFLSLLRIATGLLLLLHGTSKFFGIPVTSQTGVELMSTSGLIGVIQLVAGGLLTVGLFTRPMALILAITMAVVYVLFHAHRSHYPILNGGELAIMFGFASLLIAGAGPGPISLDRMLGRS